MKTFGKSSIVLFAFALNLVMQAAPSESFIVAVSNERDGHVSLIDGNARTVFARVPVGKRPRGIHASSDGKLLYVAVSGTPISGPPKLDAQGNPIVKEEEDDAESDHSADGIAVVDLGRRAFVKKLPAGSDPEQFILTPDGARMYIANEDVATASVLNLASEKVEQIFRVKREPEGVALSPDGRFVYVTCESGGEVCVLDTSAKKQAGEFTVGGRPRNVAFLPDSSRAFVPSESSGLLHIVDAVQFKVLKSIALPKGSRPMGLAITRDGKTLYITNGRAGTVSVFDTAGEKVIANVKVGTRPWGIGLSPDEKFLFVANGPSDDISIIDTGSHTEVQRVQCGEGPWGIAIIPGPAGK
jgi:YVTN family beta-propeller protein